MKMKRGKAVLASMFALAVSWAGVASAKEVIDFQVMVIPERGDNVVANYWAGSRRSNCVNKNHPGCYEVPEGEQAEVRVTLTNGDNTCARAESWRLKEIVLGGEGDVENPPDKPADDGWGKLSPEAARDFNADPETGIARVDFDGNTAIIQNLNSAPYSIWYKIRVESCHGSPNKPGRVIEFDPRIDNRGNG